MRGRLFGLLLAAAVIFPGTASASPVLLMGPGGHVHLANDRFLTPAGTPESGGAVTHGKAAPPARAVAARAPARKRAPQRTVASELSRLYRAGQISSAQSAQYTAGWGAAASAVKHLHGTRAAELKAVIVNLQAMAAAGALTPSRLPVLFLTLDRNRQWWTSGPLLSTYQRVEFTGSNLVWEYYPGQGIELQVLGTFSKADGLYTAGKAGYSQLRALLAEMIPLAVERAGGLVWEYYFRWEGGLPPWTSAMSQGTGIEALTRASEAFGPAAGPAGSPYTYLQIAQQALPVFTVAPPSGVRVPTPVGARYLQYSFAPRTEIINAFLQSLIGLYDFALLSGNQEAQQLFQAGNAQAQAELPGFDTGAWSLYQPGVEDSLDYHVLVTGFLDQLCTRAQAPIYCRTAERFHAYMKIAPALRQLTTQAPGKRPFRLRFSLSKYSHVGIVISQGQQTALRTSASFGHGVDGFTVPPLKSGTYQVVLAATDLPGNFARITASLKVSPPGRST